MQRIRKESETVSSPSTNAVSRVRRESDRFRNEILTSDGGHLNVPTAPINREVKIAKKKKF